MFFLLQNRSSLLMREHLYSVSVVIVTINGEMDDTHYATNFESKFVRCMSPAGDAIHIHHMGHFRI